MDKPLERPAFIFPTPDNFALGWTPPYFGAYKFYSIDLRGGNAPHIFAFGWDCEVPGDSYHGRTWMEEKVYAEYQTWPNPRAKAFVSFDTQDATFTETSWLGSDGTVFKTHRTAVPHVQSVDYMEETVHHAPGFWRLAIATSGRPVLMPAKLLTGPESTRR